MIASFKMDENYFKESLNEWIASVSKGRKFEPYLCLLFFLIGVTILILFPNFKISGILAICISVFECFRYLQFKKQWIKDRINSKVYGKEMVFEFQNGTIKQTKPEVDVSNASTGPVKVLVSKKGYFIYLKDKNFIYVPHSSFSSPLSRDEALKLITG